MQKEIVNYKSEFFKQQENYISIIKHDFSIPVIAQIRALELLAKETFGSLNNEQKEIISSTLTSCRTLYNMMSDILYSYNLEHKNIKLNKSKIDVVKLFKELLILENNKHLRKNLRIKVNSTDKIFNITCDIEKMTQALRYLIDYCFSFVSDNTFITCNMFCNKKHINCSIMFESLYISNNKLTKIGNNLRLNLAKNIIKAHKGKLVIETNYPLNVIEIELKR